MSAQPPLSPLKPSGGGGGEKTHVLPTRDVFLILCDAAGDVSHTDRAGWGGGGGPPVQTDHILVEVGGCCRQVADAELLPSSEEESHSPPNQLLFDSPPLVREIGPDPDSPPLDMEASWNQST